MSKQPSNLLIHIGFHKTASSWLQSNLFRRKEFGFYPIGEDVQSIGEKFIFDKDGALLSSFEDRNEEIQYNFKTTEENNYVNNGVGVISSERLSGNPHSGYFDSKIIADRLYNCFPQAKVLIVIREQISMITSLYFQYLKCGGIGSLERYLSEKYDGRIPKFFYHGLRYDNHIRHYKALFGEKNVIVLPYEMLKNEPYLFIDHISRFCGIEPPSSLPVNKKENDAGACAKISMKKLRWLNLFRKSGSINCYSPLVGYWSNKFVRVTFYTMGKIITERYAKKHTNKVKSYIKEYMGEYYSESNRKTELLTGLDLKDKYSYS